MSYKILKRINEIELMELYELLENTKHKRNLHREKNAGIGFTNPYGLVSRRPQFVGDPIRVMDSLQSTKNKELNDALHRFGNKYNLNFTSIQVNKNYTCLPHKDTANFEISYLISFGEYSDGNLVIIDDNNKHNSIDSYCKLIAFDGSKYTHYNLPHKGTKYSLVYFRNKNVLELLKKI